MKNHSFYLPLAAMAILFSLNPQVRGQFLQHYDEFTPGNIFAADGSVLQGAWTYTPTSDAAYYFNNISIEANPAPGTYFSGNVLRLNGGSPTSNPPGSKLNNWLQSTVTVSDPKLGDQELGFDLWMAREVDNNQPRKDLNPAEFFFRWRGGTSGQWDHYIAIKPDKSKVIEVAGGNVSLAAYAPADLYEKVLRYSFVYWWDAGSGLYNMDVSLNGELLGTVTDTARKWKFDQYTWFELRSQNTLTYVDNVYYGQVRSVMQAPVITSGPLGASILTGESHVFTVTATGDLPMTYYWYKDNRLISTSEQPELRIAEATLADAGTYKVIVSNQGGSDESVPVVLSVTAPVSSIYDNSPYSISVGHGFKANFFAYLYDGFYPFVYLWRLDGVAYGWIYVQGDSESVYYFFDFQADAGAGAWCFGSGDFYPFYRVLTGMEAEKWKSLIP